MAEDIHPTFQEAESYLRDRIAFLQDRMALQRAAENRYQCVAEQARLATAQEGLRHYLCEWFSLSNDAAAGKGEEERVAELLCEALLYLAAMLLGFWVCCRLFWWIARRRLDRGILLRHLHQLRETSTLVRGEVSRRVLGQAAGRPVRQGKIYCATVKACVAFAVLLLLGSLQAVSYHAVSRAVGAWWSNLIRESSSSSSSGSGSESLPLHRLVSAGKRTVASVATRGMSSSPSTAASPTASSPNRLLWLAKGGVRSWISLYLLSLAGPLLLNLVLYLLKGMADSMFELLPGGAAGVADHGSGPSHPLLRRVKEAERTLERSIQQRQINRTELLAQRAIKEAADATAAVATELLEAKHPGCGALGSPADSDAGPEPAGADADTANKEARHRAVDDV